MSKKLITVFGATGNQGGSVISTWLANAALQEKYAIRAVTRDPTKPEAKSLATHGVEVVKADMEDAESLRKAIAGSYGLFSVTNFWELLDGEKEKAQGIAVADAAFHAGVKHLVWSSLPHTTKLTNGKLSNIHHFVSKAEVEEYIESKKGQTVATYYMPGVFMNQILQEIRPGQDGVLTLAFPFSAELPLPLIAIREDTGKYVWGILESGAAANGRRVQAVSDWRNSHDIVKNAAKAIGKEVKFFSPPQDVFKGWLAAKMGDFMAEELTENMDLMSEYSYYGRGSESNQQENDQILYQKFSKTTLEEFVSKYKWKFD